MSATLRQLGHAGTIPKLAGSGGSAATGSGAGASGARPGCCAQAPSSTVAQALRRTASSRLLKRRKALQVMVRIAELLRDHRQAAEAVAHLQLLAHAHAAVQLHRLLADVARAVGDLDLRRRDRA